MLAPTESGNKMHRMQQRKHWLIAVAVLLTVILITVISIQMARPEEPSAEVFDGLPHAYTYLMKESPGKLQLYMMSLAPNDIVLRTAGAPLRQIAAYGINGGFFFGTDILSVAIMNDLPVGGARGAYGSGWFNAKYARGTLVFDGTSGRMSVQVVSSGDELEVSDRSNYWAQGGISMNLQHEELWADIAAAEHLPFAGEQRMRSGLVYDKAGILWLLVTPTLSTAEEFRTAVLQSVPGEELEGIFLDGDGSSQMNADEAVLTGDSRAVVQMIAVTTDN